MIVFELGDGLFETLLFTSGELVLAEAHARRMVEGAAVLGLPALSPAVFVECALAAVRDAGLAQARAAVRITLTAGSGGRDGAEPADPRTAGGCNRGGGDAARPPLRRLAPFTRVMLTLWLIVLLLILSRCEQGREDHRADATFTAERPLR